MHAVVSLKEPLKRQVQWLAEECEKPSRGSTHRLGTVTEGGVQQTCSDLQIAQTL